MSVSQGTISQLAVEIQQPDSVSGVNFAIYDKMIVYANIKEGYSETNAIVRITDKTTIANYVLESQVDVIRNIMTVLGTYIDVLLKENITLQAKDTKNTKDIKNIKQTSDEVSESLNSGFRHLVDLVGDFRSSNIPFLYSVYRNISKEEALANTTTKIKGDILCVSQNNTLAGMLCAYRCSRGSINNITYSDIPYTQSIDFTIPQAKLLRENLYTYTLNEENSGVDKLVYAYGIGYGVLPSDIVGLYAEDRMRNAVFTFLQINKPPYNQAGCNMIASVCDNELSNLVNFGYIERYKPTRINFSQQVANDIKDGIVKFAKFYYNISYSIWYIGGEIKNIIEV